MDSGTSIQTGLPGYPRNSHAICNFKLARNECRKQNSRILTGMMVVIVTVVVVMVIVIMVIVILKIRYAEIRPSNFL